MITAISLTNFKCFKALRLPLGKLTLLTGFNAAGKSTTTQTILLVSQTIRKRERGSHLWLNGPLLTLGSPGDIVNQDQSGAAVRLGVGTNEVELLWTVESVELDDERVLRVSQLEVTEGRQTSVIPVDGGLHRLLPDSLGSAAAERVVSALYDTIYISAVRRVETDVFPAPEDPNPIYAEVGSCGEYAPWWFHHCDDLEIDRSRCVPGVDAPRTLRGQVNAWLSQLFPGGEVNAQPVPKTRLMRLELRTGKTEEWRRPCNTGYGLSYAFPVLVAGLCARTDQVMVVDSPEAHLHPRGQSRMGRFLAQIAASGVQVIVETHSDHVLNGVRISLKEHLIRPEDAAIYFFTVNREGDASVVTVTTISADQEGNLSDWPKGFFDQSENDLGNLAGWS